MNILEQLDGLVSAKIGELNALFGLFKLEARLAGLTVFPLLLNLCLMLIILTGVWLSFMIVLGSLIFTYYPNLLVTASSVFILNISLLFGLVKYLQNNLRNLSFVHTRAYFSKQETNHDSIETPVEKRDCSNADNIALPTKQGRKVQKRTRRK